MVYIPRISFKSGISPSLLAWFPTNGKYSGTQKLLLTRTRIFGNKIRYMLKLMKWKFAIRCESMETNELRSLQISYSR